MLKTLCASLDDMLKGWKMGPSVEDSTSIQVSWTWGKFHIVLTIYFALPNASLGLHLLAPQKIYERQWQELSGGDIDKIIESVATFATYALNIKKVS